MTTLMYRDERNVAIQKLISYNQLYFYNDNPYIATGFDGVRRWLSECDKHTHTYVHMAPNFFGKFFCENP